MAKNIQALISEYFAEKIRHHLLSENKCCLHMTASHSQLDHDFGQKIHNFGLKSRIHMINGMNVLKIYKSSCCHNVHQPSAVKLTEKSQKDILHHLKNIEFGALQHEMYTLPQLFKPLRQKPNLPPNRFTIGHDRKAVYRANVLNEEEIFKAWKIYPFRENILRKLHQSQVLVVNGDVSFEKSTTIPMFVVQESIARGAYCKILCVEADNMSAITHSTILTKCIHERIGGRVGFQVYLQSRICDNTNIIYTTAVFFLRVLMGQQLGERFRHMSHIVVSDVHLHHAYTDILLQEIKSILHLYPQIKIILLSDSPDNGKFLTYFDQSNEFNLPMQPLNVETYYLEEINLLIAANQKWHGNGNKIMPDANCVELADMALENYARTGSDAGLNGFLHFVHSGYVPVDYAHSSSCYTALILAARRGNVAHVLRLLTCENANPLMEDFNKNTAVEYALSRNETYCASILLNSVEANARKFKPPPIDFALISKLIQLLTTSWQVGNILVFLPTYEDLLQLNYVILKLQFTGKLPQEISIHMLHSDMRFNELQAIISELTSAKIILATRRAESFPFMSDIKYVIDSSQESFEKYVPEQMCKVTAVEWASLESLHRRALVAGRSGGVCFRLIPRGVVATLTPVTPPEMLYMCMNRIALTVKLICPQKTVSEYLQQAIVRPPSDHVHDSIKFLKQIEVFDCAEEVTWLGCRLADVPMDLELGKALVLSILLKCLDPVLTIVSFLDSTTPREMALCQLYQSSDNREKKKESSESAAGGVFSDHLNLLRLYQLWQNDRRNTSASDIQSNATAFVVNGILDKVCEIRTYMVGALRSVLLIHNQGQLGMHALNLKANNWAVIKAALTGGLYPKLCMIDGHDGSLKSKMRTTCVHPISTICSKDPLRRPSNWIVFCGSNDGAVNAISDCTLVNSATVAVLVGKTEEVNPENILFRRRMEPKLNFNSLGIADLFIDDWIWLVAESKSALLLYWLRQRFSMAFVGFLQTCGNNEMWRRSNATTNEILHVCDLVSKILLEEDLSEGFVQPTKVGNRPKAIPNKSPSDFNEGCLQAMDCRRNVDAPRLPLVCLKREFFLLVLFENHTVMKSLAQQSVVNVSRDPLFALICSSASCQKLTYVIACNLNRKQITNVALVKFKNGNYILHNGFQVNIPISDVLVMCKARELEPPSFNESTNLVKLDNHVGELILDIM